MEWNLLDNQKCSILLGNREVVRSYFITLFPYFSGARDIISIVQTRLASFPLAPVREASDTKCVGGGGGGCRREVREETVCLWSPWLCNSLRKPGTSYLVGTASRLASPGSKSDTKIPYIVFYMDCIGNKTAFNVFSFAI